MQVNTPDSTEPATGQKAGMPGARVSLVLLLCINLVNYIDRYVLAAVEPLIAKDVLAADDPNSQSKMGLLATAFMVSYMLTAPVFGWFGDRFKRWWLIGIGVLLWTIASGASGLSHDAGLYLKTAGIGWLSGFGVLLLTRCFVGVGEGAYGPIAPSIISDMYPVARRGQVLSWFYIAIPVGSALGYVIGGKIGAAFGWQWAFFAVVPPGIILGIWCFFRREPARDVVPADKQLSRGEAFRVLLRNRSYVLNVLGMTAMTFAIGGVSFWMPRYIGQRLMAEGIVIGDLALERATAQANAMFGPIVVVTGILATLSGGWLGDKLRSRFSGSYFLVSGAAMLLGFPLFLAVLFTPFPYCWVTIALAVFCLFFNTGPTNTIIANVTPSAIRSTAFAFCILTIHALGDAISPAVIGFVSDVASRVGGTPDPVRGMNIGFSVVSITILISGVFWLMGARHLARDTAAASNG